MTQYYTGIDFDAFDKLVQILIGVCEKDFALGNVMGPYNEVLFVLMKLRHNFGFTDLSFRFEKSSTQLRRIFYPILYLLHRVIFVAGLQSVFPSLKKIRDHPRPETFKDFDSVRVIIDCTEVKATSPSNMSDKASVYSHYKSNYTFKALVGISPNGWITFVSELYGGSVSDKEITRNCGILDLLSPGDTVMADKGFRIHDILPPGVSLNIPPFLCKDASGKKQFTVDQARKTTLIARARVHVERAIQRIKLYKILHEVSPAMRPHASVIFQTCAALVNIQSPILKFKT